MAQLNHTVSSTPPTNSFDPIPAGDYIAQITDSNIKPTKAGTGMILNLTWTILDGPFANRKVFERLNIVNQKPDTERYARDQLDRICYAVGVKGAVRDSNQLHGRPCKIRVKIRKDEGYGESNDVTGYKEIAFSASAPMQHSVAAQLESQTGTPLNQAGGSTPPWAARAA